MRVKSIAACCVSGILALSLIACGGQPAKEEPAKEESAEVQKTEDTKRETTANDAKKAAKKETKKQEKKDDRQVLGTQGEDAIEVALTNGLENPIAYVSIRTSGEESYADNLLPEEGSVAANEEVRLFVAPAQAEDAKYDLLVRVDGQEGDVEFIEVPLASLSKATLKQADGVAYVDYVTAEGEEGSTKEAALARKQAQEEAVAAAEAAEAAAAEAAQQEEQYVAEQYYEPEPVEDYSYDYAPVEAPSAPEQSEDSCAGDVVLRY